MDKLHLMNKQHVNVFTPAVGEPVARFVFAHGAGASMDSDFMVDMAQKLAAYNIEVYRFNFPYMQMMSESGKRRPPNRMSVLLEDFHTVVAAQETDLPVFIGGKSMGGRVSTMIGIEPQVIEKIKGIIALGYPFHPSGKPEKLRIDHLPNLLTPCVIIQGERDLLGNKTEITGYDLPDDIQFEYLTDGDHSFKPRKASGVTLADNMALAAKHIATFIGKNL